MNPIVNHINQIASDADCGLADPLEVFIQLKQIEKSLEAALTSIRESAIKEAAKYPEKTFSYKGAEVTKKSGSARYDYKHISGWAKLESDRKRIEDLAKLAASKSVQVTDELTGEIIEPARVTYTAETLQIIFKP
jgi:hypothetical protein